MEGPESVGLTRKPEQIHGLIFEDDDDDDEGLRLYFILKRNNTHICDAILLKPFSRCINFMSNVSWENHEEVGFFSPILDE